MLIKFFLNYFDVYNASYRKFNRIIMTDVMVFSDNKLVLEKTDETDLF